MHLLYIHLILLLQSNFHFTLSFDFLCNFISFLLLLLLLVATPFSLRFAVLSETCACVNLCSFALLCAFFRINRALDTNNTNNDNWCKRCRCCHCWLSALRGDRLPVVRLWLCHNLDRCWLLHFATHILHVSHTSLYGLIDVSLYAVVALLRCCPACRRHIRHTSGVCWQNILIARQKHSTLHS